MALSFNADSDLQVRENVRNPLFFQKGGAKNTFEGSNIRELYFEGNTIPEGICKNMTSLVKVVLAEGVTIFGDLVFKGCTSLSDFTFPHTMTTLGVCSFENCDGIKELTIRSNLTTTNYSALGSPLSYSGIEQVSVEEGVTSIPSYFFDKSCSTIESLYLPSTLSSIGYNAFRGGENMTVYYAGTEEQWSKVSKSSFKPANVVYGAEPQLGLMSAFMLSSVLPSAEELMALDEDDESMSTVITDDDEFFDPEVIEEYQEESFIEEEHPEPEQAEQSKGSGGMLYIFLIITGAGVLIGYYYIRIYKPGKEEQEADSEDMEGTGSEEGYEDSREYESDEDEPERYDDY